MNNSDPRNVVDPTPEYCPICCKYSVSQFDIDLHQHCDERGYTVVSMRELVRLYGIERRQVDIQSTIDRLQSLERDMREEIWTLQLERLTHLDTINTLQDQATRDRQKIRQLEILIDMFNMRVQNQEKKYSRLLVKHTTLMKED